MDIHSSARRHGIAEADVHHAVVNHEVSFNVGDNPTRIMYLGPDRSGRMLEVVTIVRVDRSEIAIHAMVMRPQYRRHLRRRSRR